MVLDLLARWIHPPCASSFESIEQVESLLRYCKIWGNPNRYQAIGGPIPFVNQELSAQKTDNRYDGNPNIDDVDS